MSDQLDPDRSLDDPAADRLGHAALASALVDGLISTPSPRGLVVAVFGEWGSGKTTVLNFVRRRIAQDHDDQFLVVEFSPWWFSERADLAQAFFGQLRARLQRWRHLAGRAQAGIAALGEVVSGLPLPGASAAGAAARLAGTRDAVELKRSIEESLGNLPDGRRLLIIIDDVHRLSGDQIRHLFALIKGVADFPNTLYLIAMDDAQVAAALSVDDGSQTPYLDKIVQSSVQLPRPEAESLCQMLTSGLEVIMGEPRPELFGDAEWQYLLRECLARVLTTPRDVARLLNAIRLAYPPVGDEVFVPDFVALEVIRLFAPRLHGLIQAEPDMFRQPGLTEALFTDRDRLARFHRSRWAEGDAAGGMLPADPAKAQAVTSAVCVVFPRVAGALEMGGARSTSDGPSHRRADGVAFFGAYFRLSLPPTIASKAAVDALIALADDPAAIGPALSGILRALASEESAAERSLLLELTDRAGGLSTAAAENLVKAVLDVGDEGWGIPGGGVFGLNAGELMVGVLAGAMEAVAPERRAPLLREALPCCRAVETATRFVFRLVEDPHQRLIPTTEAPTLGERAASAIERAASEGRLLESPGFAFLLYRWAGWISPDAVREYTTTLLGDPVSAAQLIVGLANRVHGDRVTLRFMNLDALEEIVDVARMASVAEGLLGAGAVEAEIEEAARALVDAHAARLPAASRPDESTPE